MNFLAWQRKLRFLLFPAAKVYAALLQLRLRAYEYGLLSSTSLNAPCVSVGNICWGGSGKTPLVAWLLHWAVEQGIQPVVLTRGYRARPPVLPYVVLSDSPGQEAGDEPLQLKHGCPEAAILVDPVRTRAGRQALCLDPDIFILDDGFQHLAVRRDIDLVLLREADLEEQWNAVIPAGSWREPESALRRASAFLIKCSRRAPEEVLVMAEKRLGKLHKAIFTFTLRARDVIPVREFGSASFGTKYLIATGVADPESVVRTAKALLGRGPETLLAFPDHHDFGHCDWERIICACRAYKTDSILCTPKDAVKLGRFAYDRLYSFDMTLDFGPYVNARGAFPDWWKQSFLSCKQEKHNNTEFCNNR